MGGEFNRELCRERHENISRELREDDERIDCLEKCTIKLTQMIEKYDLRLDDHQRRITAIETKPVKFVEKMIWYAVSALLGALAGAIVGGLLP